MKRPSKPRIAGTRPSLDDKPSEDFEKPNARQFLEIQNLTTLSEELAGIVLGLFEGRPLEIKELTWISKRLAQCLARHTAELRLTGLRQLDPAAARALCAHPLLRLDFRRMPLSDELAEVLARHQGILWIDGLASLPSSRAYVLGKHDGPVFVADKTKIEPRADEDLRNCASRSPILSKGLDLSGSSLRVRRMTTELAEALVCFRNGRLLLDSLESLSEDHAALLGGGAGILSLNGLVKISPKTVSKLVGESPTKEPPKARRLCLNGLRALGSPVARELARYQGILELNGLESLRLNEAKSLAEIDGEVHLQGLQNLDEKVARVLGPRRHLLRVSPQLEKVLEKQDAVSRAR